MKLGLGLYRALLTPENLRFAKQAGATHIVAHLPGHFTRGESKIITSDNAQAGFGVSEADDPLWTYEGLRDLKAMINAEGLELEALENFAPAHWYDVLLDGPRRAEQMAHLKQIVRDLGGLALAHWAIALQLPGFGGAVKALMPVGAHVLSGSTTRRKRRFPLAWSGTWSMTPNVSTLTNRRQPWRGHW